MSNKYAIQLIGEISGAEIIDDRLRITSSISEQSATFEVPMQSQGISKLCRALGITCLKDAEQFIGHRICLHVIQPQGANGLIPHLVVVDYLGVQ